MKEQVRMISHLSYSQKQNSRPYQEDRFSIEQFKDGSMLLGIFDGHGGSLVSEFAAQNLTAIFIQLRNLNPSTSPEGVVEAVFEQLNQETIDNHSGSTASIVYVNADHSKAYVGILGDSTVFIGQANGNVWQSPEHNVRSNPQEAAAGISRGGVIIDGYLIVNRCHSSIYGGLQMSRALGDKDLSQVLERTPEQFTIDLADGSWILLSTDGLLDCGHTKGSAASNGIIKIIQENPKLDAGNLVDIASKTDKSDNSTAILVRFSK